MKIKTHKMICIMHCIDRSIFDLIKNLSWTPVRPQGMRANTSLWIYLFALSNPYLNHTEQAFVKKTSFSRKGNWLRSVWRRGIHLTPQTNDSSQGLAPIPSGKFWFRHCTQPSIQFTIHFQFTSSDQIWIDQVKNEKYTGKNLHL